MRIFRKKKTDNGRRVSYGQSYKPTMENVILSEGENVDTSDFRKRAEDFSFVDPGSKENKAKRIRFGKDRKFRFKYTPGKYFYFNGNSTSALDGANRPTFYVHKSTEKKSAKDVYRDFLRDSKKAFELGGYKNGEIDKELREAIKKEIRRQHKIKKIKNISGVALPVLAAGTTLGIVMKNKKKKDNN